MPAATTDSVNDSALQKGPLSEDDDVSSAPQQHGAASSSENVVTAAPKEEVKEAVDVDAIKPVPSTHNLRTLRQLVDVSYNVEDRGSEENKKPPPTKRH